MATPVSDGWLFTDNDSWVPPAEGGNQTTVDQNTAPEGILQEYWNLLNGYEKLLCSANVSQCASKVIPAMREALAWAKAEAEAHGTNDIDNEYDAMRHAYWSAMLTRDIGVDLATQWNIAHEKNPDTLDRHCMDAFNNGIGRSIGAAHADADNYQLQGYVMHELNVGHLRVTPYCG